jgi:hypothetical protein
MKDKPSSDGNRKLKVFDRMSSIMNLVGNPIVLGVP